MSKFFLACFANLLMFVVTASAAERDQLVEKILSIN